MPDSKVRRAVGMINTRKRHWCHPQTYIFNSRHCLDNLIRKLEHESYFGLVLLSYPPTCMYTRDLHSLLTVTVY